MALRTFSPTTPSRRNLVSVDKRDLWKGGPEKSLVKSMGSNGGRSRGTISVRHRGGGARRKYRIIDFTRGKEGVEATVLRLEYDPNRTSFIALLEYTDGELSYILAPKNLKVGDKVISGSDSDIKPGNCLRLKDIPVGIHVHNVEMKAGKGGQIARAAGAYVQITGKSDGYVLLKLKSGEVRMVRGECRATIGELSNTDHQNINLGKAGASRWKGRRPKVRGTAMNPVDHPHGGGEGKSRGKHLVSPSGVCTKGKRTRRNNSTDKYILRRRYKK